MAHFRIRGGEKFERELRALAEKVKSKKTLQVGFLGGAYPDGTPVAMVAAIHNYGAPKRNIPPRPFFTNMIREKSPEWPRAIAGLLERSKFDVMRTLTITGEAIAGQLRDSILNGSYAPLRPGTVKRKGSAQPLVDTHKMVDSVDFNIK